MWLGRSLRVIIRCSAALHSISTPLLQSKTTLVATVVNIGYNYCTIVCSTHLAGTDYVSHICLSICASVHL